MKKVFKYTPWLIAGGAIAIAVVTRQHYASKTLLELPTMIFHGQRMLYVPPVSDPLVYTLKNGAKVAVHIVEKVSDIAVTP